MSVRANEEILEAIKKITGENTSDDVITLLEDVQDTLNDYGSRINEAGDWKAKYEENDTAWRKRYTDRFYNGTSENEDVERGQETSVNLMKQEKESVLTEDDIWI